MKKTIIAIMSVVCIVLTITGCGCSKVGQCEMCGSEGIVHEATITDNKGTRTKTICSNCYDNLEMQAEAHNARYPDDKYKISK